MHYKTLTAWIFVILVLLVFFMALYPTPFFIGLGFIGLPVLVLVQAVIVLRARDESKHTFSDEKWYEDREEGHGSK